MSQKINTFASQRFIFKEKNKPFLLQNASNLTHDFYMTIVKKNLLNFLVKTVIKNKAQGSENVKTLTARISIVDKNRTRIRRISEVKYEI